MRKIVQIATSVSWSEDNGADENLYALDDEGTLWWWSFGERTWHTMPDLPKEKDEP